MTEKQLLAKIRELRQIKPRKDWVVLTKSQILGKEERKMYPSLFFWRRPVFAVLTVTVIVIIGVLGFSQNSLPGDFLYSVKRAAEEGQAVFVPEKEQPKHNLEIANKRLDDLAKIVETNSVKNLAVAINEYQNSVSKAAESLAKETGKNAKSVKDIALEVKKLEEKTEKVKLLGVEIGGSEELNNALAQIVEQEISDLEKQILTQEQQEILAEAKENYQEGDLTQALEKVLLLGQ